MVSAQATDRCFPFAVEVERVRRDMIRCFPLKVVEGTVGRDWRRRREEGKVQVENFDSSLRVWKGEDRCPPVSVERYLAQLVVDRKSA